jgi:hypothetical protein
MTGGNAKSGQSGYRKRTDIYLILDNYLTTKLVKHNQSGLLTGNSEFETMEAFSSVL